MDRGKRLIGVVLIVLSIAALFSWERWGKAQFLYDEVLVCRENVSKGTVLREDMVETVKMDVAAAGWISPEKKSRIIGKEATSFIHKGMPLFPQYFDKAGLTAGSGAGKYVLAIPQDWQASMPASISRGDSASFFSGGKLLLQAPVSSTDKENRAVEVIVTEKQAGILSKVIARGEKLVVVYQ